MTRKEWRTCRDPVAMIEALRPVANDRKKILYLCGGSRCLWDLLYGDWSRRGVEVAERFADGLATREELRRASWEAECPTFGFAFDPGIRAEWEGDFEISGIPEERKRLIEMGLMTEAQVEADSPEVDPAIRGRLVTAAYLAFASCNLRNFDHDWIHGHMSMGDWPGEWLVRCVFGKPFDPPIPINPRWKTPGVLALAETMYADRAFDQMPSLGDMLAEAGCRQHVIQKHCWSEHPHVRGCWLVDALLGKS